MRTHPSVESDDDAPGAVCMSLLMVAESVRTSQLQPLAGRKGYDLHQAARMASGLSVARQGLHHCTAALLGLQAAGTAIAMVEAQALCVLAVT